MSLRRTEGRMKILKKFKEGVASFYVVVFATLILLVVVISFAAIIATEMTKSSNDDLSQSAYDSAMAGIEDAKLAYYDYQNCLFKKSAKSLPLPDNDGSASCGEILWYMESDEKDYKKYNEDHPGAELDRCDMVSYILGRNNQVTESNVSNNMQQEYTCVQLNNSLPDYRGTLSSSNTTKVVKAKFDDVNASKINKIKISWYVDTGAQKNYNSFSSSRVSFKQQADIPPTISLALLQTSELFDLSDFDTTHGEQTNRGMLYLVPTDNKSAANKDGDSNYLGAYNGDINYIDKKGFLKSNDKTAQNLPYAVYCDPDGDEGEEFLCSAEVELPEPINGKRNDDTFVFIVGLPYGKPTTDFSMEFYCADGETCAKTNVEDEAIITDKNKANLKNVQVNIDSTGRANDLYRRLETRLEDTSDYALSIFGPLELLGNDPEDRSNISLEKQLEVTIEHNF